MIGGFGICAGFTVPPGDARPVDFGIHTDLQIRGLMSAPMSSEPAAAVAAAAAVSKSAKKKAAKSEVLFLFLLVCSFFFGSLLLPGIETFG